MSSAEMAASASTRAPFTTAGVVESAQARGGGLVRDRTKHERARDLQLREILRHGPRRRLVRRYVVDGDARSRAGHGAYALAHGRVSGEQGGSRDLEGECGYVRPC